MKDSDPIISNGMEGLLAALKKEGMTLDDIDVDNIKVYDADSFVARRVRIEEARRNKQRTPQK